MVRRALAGRGAAWGQAKLEAVVADVLQGGRDRKTAILTMSSNRPFSHPFPAEGVVGHRRPSYAATTSLAHATAVARGAALADGASGATARMTPASPQDYGDDPGGGGPAGWVETGKNDPAPVIEWPSSVNGLGGLFCSIIAVLCRRFSRRKGRMERALLACPPLPFHLSVSQFTCRKVSPGEGRKFFKGKQEKPTRQKERKG